MNLTKSAILTQAPCQVSSTARPESRLDDGRMSFNKISNPYTGTLSGTGRFNSQARVWIGSRKDEFNKISNLYTGTLSGTGRFNSQARVWIGLSKDEFNKISNHYTGTLSGTGRFNSQARVWTG